MNDEKVDCQKYISCNGSCKRERDVEHIYERSGGRTDKEIDLGAKEFPKLLRNHLSHLSERAS